MKKRKYSTFIIDDEPDARSLLSDLMAEFPDFEITANASSVDQALPLILKHHPDLLFLDIQMPGRSGFDLVQELRSLEVYTPVIFVTAYNQFAIQAIKASALDYLMKPVDPVELAKALQKFMNRVNHEDYQQRMEALLLSMQNEAAPPAKIRFSHRTGFLQVDPADIVYLGADRNYTILFLRGSKQELISTNLGQVETNLPHPLFQRISRTHIINTTYLSRVDRPSRTCQLICGEETIVLKATMMGKDVWG